MKEQSIMQYYYRTKDCKAKTSKSDDCSCWHDEGTGLFDKSKYNEITELGYKEETPTLEWRIKPINR